MAKARIVTGGWLLAESLRTRGLSQLALEQMLHVGRGVVSRWLSGDRTPSLAHALALERVLGIDPKAWLLLTTRSARSRSAA